MNLTIVKLIMVMVFWGSAFVSGRMLAQHYHPYTIAFVRFFLASLVLIPFLYWRNKQAFRINLNLFLRFCLLGFTGVFLYNYFFFNGLKIVEAGRSSVIIATNPTITTFFAALLLGEKVTPAKIIGIALALAGATLVITGGHPSLIFSGGFDKGELYIVGAVFSWVAYTLMGKSVLKTVSALTATTWACLLGAIMLFPFALQHDLANVFRESHVVDWVNFSNLGLLSTVLGFIWYYEGIHHIGASRASAFINFVPIVAVSFGVIFLGEKVSLSLVFGATLVIFGILLINLKKRST